MCHTKMFFCLFVCFSRPFAVKAILQAGRGRPRLCLGLSGQPPTRAVIAVSLPKVGACCLAFPRWPDSKLRPPDRGSFLRDSRTLQGWSLDARFSRTRGRGPEQGVGEGAGPGAGGSLAPPRKGAEPPPGFAPLVPGLHVTRGPAPRPLRSASSAGAGREPRECDPPASNSAAPGRRGQGCNFLPGAAAAAAAAQASGAGTGRRKAALFPALAI